MPLAIALVHTSTQQLLWLSFLQAVTSALPLKVRRTQEFRSLLEFAQLTCTQPCTMVRHSLWPLDLASHLQVRQWQRSCSHSSFASWFSALPLSRSHPRTCLVLPSRRVSQQVDMQLVQCLVDL